MKITNMLPGLLGLPFFARSVAAALTNITLQNPPQPPANLLAHTVADAVNTDGYAVRAYTWPDSTGQNRSISLVNSSGKDPAGFYGGYMRNYNYTVNGTRRDCSSSDPDHPGFGFLVNHYIDNGTYPSESSRFHTSIGETTYLAGRHHSIHELKYNYTLGGEPMAATIHWYTRSSGDHPIWAVTYDTSAAAPNQLKSDFRSPYGDFDFDGGHDAIVAGVGWGDHYQFSAGNQTLTMASGWRYDVPNTVPYVQSFTLAPDAEMGLVQTQTYMQHDLGGYDGYRFWNTSAPSGPMPAAESWPFQINQYSLPYTNTSKRIALGSNYGAVGQKTYLSYGDDRNLSGSPFQSYAVHIVLGLHSAQAVAQQVAAVEAVQQATLVAGTNLNVLTAMPAGVGRTDTTAQGGPAGYNPAYATWDLAAAANVTQMGLTLQMANGTLFNPTFVVHNWPSTEPPVAVSSNAVPLVADSLQGYMASVDAARQTLWLTVGAEVSAQKPLMLAIAAPEPLPVAGPQGKHWSALAVGLSVAGALVGAAGVAYGVTRAVQKVREPVVLGA